jgi:alanine racemase
MQTRPVWAEISINRLIHNYQVLRAAAGDAGLIAVVKANAYGHGAPACAAALEAAGAQWLGVTNVEEGIAVREVRADARVLVMSGVWHDDAEAAIAGRLTPVVWEAAHFDWLEDAAMRRGERAQSVPVHLEIDTGMARQGVRPCELPAMLERLRAAKSLSLEGVITHFHSPEFLSGEATTAQMECLDSALKLIASCGFRPSLVHAGNSATLLAGDGARRVLNLAAKYGASAMLRPGLALYGYAPRFAGDGALAAAGELQPVLAWKTRVISLRTIETGESAGYGATFHARRRSRLALLPVGYADGLNRLLSNRGEVLVRGRRAPMVGRISMDLTIADVTDVDGVELGDEVVLIGEQKDSVQGIGDRVQNQDRITAYELADLAGTIPYEVLCNISARVPRVSEDHA